ncbi:MAG: AMP-binding protein, partial [Halioglobus sp.]|nr:AMP-binding protein [Halioglobus sp.]
MPSLKQEFDQAIAQLTAEGSPYEVATGSSGERYYRSAPANLVEALAAGRAHGDREFLIYEGERRSFDQLFAEADSIAAALQAAGIKQGERVAIAMRNYPEWMAAYLAIIGIGAVVVPVNSWGQPADIAHAVEDCGARCVFLDQQRYDGVAERFAGQGIRVLLVRPDDPDHEHALSAFAADFASVAPEPVAISGNDLAMIMYTSGTSGKPKGAASTHRAVAQAVFNMECAAMAAAMTNGELIGAMLEQGFEPTSLLAVPLFHVSGCHAQFFVNLRGGRRIVMMYKW